jgi:hypothetical protein
MRGLDQGGGREFDADLAIVTVLQDGAAPVRHDMKLRAAV